RRPHHQLPRGDRSVRGARADRAARPLPRGVDPALAILRISGAGRGGCRLSAAAAGHHRAGVLAAAREHRPAPLRRGGPPGGRGYAAVTGKGGERRIIRLGPWRWAMFGYALFVCALSVILPMAVLLQAAFAKAWGRGLSLDNLTLHNFHYLLFEQTQAQQAIVNTFVYSGATAFAAIGLSLAIAYVVNRRLIPFGGALGFLGMGPSVIPAIVPAIGFYPAYAPPPLALYGTAAILILAYTTRFLPIAYASSSAAMRSISAEMEEAVRILGGGRL